MNTLCNGEILREGEPSAESWKECREKCQSNQKCQGWTYAEDSHPTVKLRKACLLFTSISECKRDDSATSGRRDCTGKLSYS